MRILALDLGDSWIGIASSDRSGMFAHPLKTIPAAALVQTLQEILADDTSITTIVVGHPITMKGEKSQQTLLVETTTEKLKALFPQITWILRDERLSSKRAAVSRPARNKEDKLRQHAVAAAHILDIYLIFRASRN